MEDQQTSKTINGRTYTVAKMPAFRALDVFEMIVSLVGPGFVSIVGINEDVTKVAQALFSKLGGGKIKELTKVLLDGVIVEENGKQSPMLTGFDLRYSGKLWEVFQVLGFVVEVNYADFFAGARDAVLALVPKLKLLFGSSLPTSSEDGSPSSSGSAGT